MKLLCVNDNGDLRIVESPSYDKVNNNYDPCAAIASNIALSYTFRTSLEFYGLEVIEEWVE